MTLVCSEKLILAQIDRFLHFWSDFLRDYHEKTLVYYTLLKSLFCEDYEKQVITALKKFIVLLCRPFSHILPTLFHNF